jgi:hypothetical protein
VVLRPDDDDDDVNMMKYVHCTRIHSEFFHDVKESFVEIAKDRYARRVVCKYVDGVSIKVGYWRKFTNKYKFGLGDQPWPEFQDLLRIAETRDEGWQYNLISKEEFEREWKHARYAW